MSAYIHPPIKRPAYIPSPGEIIADELEERGWSQQQFAEIIGRTPSKVNDIIHARRAIDLEMAKILSVAFEGTSPQFWINLQTSYSLSKSPQSDKEKAVALKARMAGHLNIKELQKRGIIPDTNNLDELESSVLNLLGISSFDENIHYAVSFRASNYVKSEKINIQTWCKIVETKATSVISSLPDYDPTRFEECREALLALTKKADGIKEVAQVLSQYGIAFVIEKQLPKTGIDGATFEIMNHPVIALSLRYDRIDSFWFTLFHELAHCRDKDYHCDCTEDREDKANQEAQEWLLPEKSLQAFLQKNGRKLTTKTIEIEAQRLNRHISILLGQLKKRKIISYCVAADKHGKASDYIFES